MMRGTWIICRKELNSYFASPIAYSVMALFTFIFGFFFYEATSYFMQMSMESQMQGRGFPMNINEMIVRPVLSNMSVIVLFLLPMLAMRIFSEEKRSGTMELLVTSPVSDNAIVVGKWLGAYRAGRRLVDPVPVPLRQAGLEAGDDRLAGLDFAGRGAARVRGLSVIHDEESDCRGRSGFRIVPVLMGGWLGFRVRYHMVGPVPRISLRHESR
jgi:hypothetical protein